MNGFLWVGIASTVVLLAAIVIDGLDEAIDIFELGPDWLSLPVLATLVGAFGFITGATIGVLGPAALVLGAIGGVAFAYGAVRFMRSVMSMRTDATETEADLLASFGRVVTAPNPDRYGAVLLDRPSGPLKVACRSEQEIPVGTEVVVVDVSSSTLVTVVPFDPGIPELPQ